MPRKLSNEKWIKRFKKIHGNSIDYSQTNVNDKDHDGRILFICPFHGPFRQSIRNHYNLKHGCPKCNGGIRSTRDEFIQKSKSMYGEYKYLYDKVVYVNNRTEVIITCPIHGDFTVTPSNHLNPSLRAGCPYCKGKIDIVSEFKKIKQKYDSQIHTILGYRFEDKSKKYFIKAHCIIHGDFEIRLDHLKEREKELCIECQKLYTKQRKEMERGLYEEENYRRVHDRYGFIWQSRQIHGSDRYGYDKLIFNNMRTDVELYCYNHKGYFTVNPLRHLRKHVGCSRCYGVYRYKDTKEWMDINLPDSLREKYDFSKAEYLGKDAQMEIVCPKHGSFWRHPYAIKCGSASCPKCNISALELQVEHALSKAGISFIFQCGNKEFQWLGRKSFDFYLTDYGTVIECQGKQHFIPREHFGGEKALVIQKELDSRKKSLCQEHGIRLIYYLPKEYVSYMAEDDTFFTDSGELIKYIQSLPKQEQSNETADTQTD